MKISKQYHWRTGFRRPGRSTVLITCPFCNTEVEAYNWSLAGSGKKCPQCGAVHISLSYCLSVKEVDRTYNEVNERLIASGQGHWMKCPECGGKAISIRESKDSDGVTIDPPEVHCTECDYNE